MRSGPSHPAPADSPAAQAGAPPPAPWVRPSRPWPEPYGRPVHHVPTGPDHAGRSVSRAASSGLVPAVPTGPQRRWGTEQTGPRAPRAAGGSTPRCPPVWRPFSQARSLSRSPWDTAFPPLSLLPNFPWRTRKAPGEAPRSWQQALGWPCSGAKDEVLPPLPSREGTVPPQGGSPGGRGGAQGPTQGPCPPGASLSPGGSASLPQALPHPDPPGPEPQCLSPRAQGAVSAPTVPLSGGSPVPGCTEALRAESSSGEALAGWGEAQTPLAKQGLRASCPGGGGRGRGPAWARSRRRPFPSRSPHRP